MLRNLLQRLDLQRDSKRLMNSSSNTGNVWTELGLNFKVECDTSSESKDRGYN